MPRPADTYTHDQFRPVDSANLGETVQCSHCKRWQGSAKVLSRKKAHLQNCPEYAAWRVAGNGQELAPPNPYNGNGRRVFGDSRGFDTSSGPLGPSLSLNMQRPRSMVDMSKYFDEFFDDSLGHKCARVRCQSCGFVRAKNATRQADHLIQCKEFLLAAEGEDFLASGSLALSEQQNHTTAIWNGARPQADVMVSPRPLSRPGGGTASRGLGPQPSPSQAPKITEAPSLAHHLLAQAEDLLTNATQHTFLLHAGSGSLGENALNQWLAQVGYISRSLVPFAGALISKIRIPETANLEGDSTFRCLDLLCSAVINMKKELEFLEATKRKYGLEVSLDEPRPPTKSFVDLLNSASCPSATLLEGMVMLWAVEILFYNSFSYAGTFVTRSMPTPQQSTYSLPSYLLSATVPVSPYSSQAKPKNGHTTALREAFIENWKSENFGRFVDVCKSIVDELAMVQATGNDRAATSACERVFNQAVWLWAHIFPQVTGVGKQSELDNGQNIFRSRDNGAMNGGHSAETSVEVDDEDVAQASTNSLFSRNALGIVAPADQAS
ncbi:hypothetical protein G7046_g2771 [Stylonectria norvegica]|nr:hypothetical protein G7046_g2771 [Stylonectria norvegica]